MPMPSRIFVRPKLPSVLTGGASSISSKKAVAGAAGVAVVSGAVVAASSGTSQNSNIAAAPVNTVASGIQSTVHSVTSGFTSFVPIILVAVGGVIVLKLLL